MKIKITFLLVFLFLFLGFRVVRAQIMINEIALNPTSGRFIELYNSDNQQIDLNGWYLQRKTENQTDFGSLVSKNNFKNKTIGANGYFLISRDAMPGADIVLSDLTLTEGNTIQLKNPKGGVIDKISWGDANIPNPPDGKSIQKFPNGWILATPTPRALNTVDANVPAPNIPNVLPIASSQTVLKPKTNIVQAKTNTAIPKVETKSINLSSQGEADVSENNSTDSYLFFGALALFLIVAGGSVYFIRRKKIDSNNGDGFEILEE